MTVFLIESEATVNKVSFKVVHIGNDSAHLSPKISHVMDTIQGSSETLLEGIEDIFNGTVDGMIRCAENDTMAGHVDHLPYDMVRMGV